MVVIGMLLVSCGLVKEQLATQTDVAATTTFEVLPTTTHIPTFTPTPTITPTSTSTSIPTLEGLSIPVPDPRITNPELFDLQKPDAPIPQFVNAMKMAGIEITAEQVIDGITFQELRDKAGNLFMVVVYNFNRNSSKQGETFDGPIVLVIAKQDVNKEWVWSDTLRAYATEFGFNIGTVLQPQYKSKNLQIEEFNAATVTYNWQRREQTIGIRTTSYVDKQLYLAQQTEQPFHLRLSHVSSSDSEPDWLKGIKSDEELKQVLRNQVRFIIETYSLKGVTQYNVVNEPFLSSYFPQRLGRDQYITIAYEEANKVRSELIDKAIKNKQEPPVIELGFSNAENHYSNGYGTQPTLEILKMLADKGWVDFVDVHFHIKQISKLPSPKDITQTLMKYGQFINKTTRKPIKVVVGEMDINISHIPVSDRMRLLKQAQIGQNIFKAILAAEITDITFWGAADYDSWYENGDLSTKEVNADALLFDDNHQPKPLYYVLLQAMYQNILE